MLDETFEAVTRQIAGMTSDSEVADWIADQLGVPRETLDRAVRREAQVGLDAAAALGSSRKRHTQHAILLALVVGAKLERARR